MEDVKDQVVDPTTNTQNAVKGIESYVLADVDPNFTYKNPSVTDALKFNMNEIKVSPKIAKISTKSEAHNDILVKNEKERSLWDKSVRVWDAFSTGAIERSDLETQTSELWFKKLQADSPNLGAAEFTGEDILKLDELDKKLQSLPNYDENYAEVISGAIGSSIGTLGRNIKDVAPLVAGASATAGAAGAFVGGPVLGVAAAQGMLATTAGPAIMYKAYKQQAGQAYGDLLKNKPVLFSGSPFEYAGKEDNQPFQFDSYNDTERYRYIAHGVGVVNGLLEGLFTKGVAKTVPWINKLMIDPKTINKVLSPSQISVLTKFGQAALQHGENGLTEVAQEIVQVVGQKAGDKSFGDISFDDIFNEQTAERYALAASAGVGASVGLSAAGKTTGTVGSLTYKGFKSLGEAGNIESNKPKFTVTTDPEARAKAIKFKLQEQAAKESYDAVKSSAVKSQSEAAHNALLKDLHGDDNVYLRNEIVKDIIAEDSAKAQKVRDKIGINITDESALTSITKDKYFQLLDLDDKFFNAIQFEEDGPVASEVDSYLAKFESNKAKAQELESKINQVNDPAEKAALINQIADLEEIKFDEFSTVEEYVNQPVLPDSLKTTTIPEKLMKLEEDVKVARKQVAEKELEVEKKKLGKMVKLDAEVQTEMEVKALEEDLKNYKVYDTIDAFTNPNVGKTEFDNILNEAGNKYAINPDTLPENLKKYAKDKTLNKYKVFDSNGIDAEESAQLLGYDSAEQMFKDMKLAEPRQKVISQYVQDRQDSIVALSEQEVGFKPELDIPRVLDNRAKLHLKEISTLMDSYKSSVKEGVRKIALPSMTKIEDLKIKAVQIAAGLKVKDLNAKMFQVNETRMDRKAVKLFNQGDIRGALKAKENAAINTLVRKEVYDINKKLNRNIVKIAKVIANNGAKDLADAGEIYTEAFKTVVDTINLDRRFDQKAQQSWIDWATTVDTEERAKYDIPSELKGNDKFSVNDMSAQSALALTETALQIHATAKRKNKLSNRYEYINEQVKIQEVADQHSRLLQNRKDYKWHLYETRNARVDDSPSAKFKKSIRSFIASHVRMEETIFRTILDRGQNNGYFTNTYWKPMEDARVYKSNLTSGVDQYISKAIEAYGSEKFYNLGYEIINDPRLANTGVFGNTPITKLDLFTMLLNFGNEGNIQALEKTFKLDRKDIKSILETHLTMDEVKLAQQHGLSFEGLWGDNVEMLKQMGENIPDRVVGQDFEFKGETVKGWYYPISLKADELKLDRIANKGLALEKKDARYKAEILTFNGHNIERTKLDDGAKLNLDYGKYRQTIEEVSHDIAFRPALTDIGKLLGNVDIQRDLFNTLGEENYNALQDWVESINNIPFETSRVEKGFDKAISKLITANQFASLGFNIGTILIQPSSMPVVFNRLSEDYNGNTLVSRGDILQEYIRTTTNMFTMTPENMKNVIGEIGKYSPDFANRLKQLDVEINKAQFDLTPETGIKWWNNTKRVNQKIAFLGLTTMNLRLNAAAWTAAYRLAESGRIKGIKVGDEQAAIDYANGVIRTELEANDPLDKSSIQRQRGAIRLFTSFYSQMNVLTNKFISAGYAANIEWMNAEGLPIKEKLKKRTEVAAQLAGRFMFTAVIPAAIVAGVRGVLRDEKEEKEFSDYVKSGAYQIADSFIGLRDISYFMQTGAKRTPTIPIYQNGADVVLAGNAMVDLALSPLKDESFQFTKKEVDALWRSGGLVGVPARPLRYLFGLFDENSQSFDFLNGVSVTGFVQEMANAVGPVTSQDNKDMLSQDAEQAFQDVDDPQSQQILQEVKSKVEPIDSFANPEGSEVYLSDVNKIQSFSASESKTMNLFMTIARQAESGNNPNAVNSDTGAAGYYQFIPSTWKALSKQYPDLGLGQNVPTGTDSITRQNKAMWKLTAKNWYALSSNGLETKPKNLYTLHLLGEKKGVSLLNADSNAKALGVVNKDELLLNPMATLGMNSARALKADLSTVTVGEVKNNIKNYLLSKGKETIRDLKLAKDEEATLITKLTEQL